MAFSAALKCAVKISRTVTVHSEILCQIILERTTYMTINADQSGLGCETITSKSILAEPFLCHPCTQIPAPSSPLHPMSLSLHCRPSRCLLLSLSLPEGQQQQDLGLGALCFLSGAFRELPRAEDMGWGGMWGWCWGSSISRQVLIKFAAVVLNSCYDSCLYWWKAPFMTKAGNF